MIYREAGDFSTSYKQDSQTFPIKCDRIGFYVTLVVAFLVIPFVINDYWANAILMPFLIYAIAALGLNILTGYTGQVSLGTGGFMAVGVCGKFVLLSHTGWRSFGVWQGKITALAFPALGWLMKKRGNPET